MAISTTIGSTDLQALRQELERERRALEERERALTMVEQMAREKTGRGQLPQKGGPSINLPVINSVNHQPHGFTNAVRHAVTQFGDNEFGVHDIESYIKKHGFQLPKADPRSRIAMVLQGLRDKGVIVRTFEGSGRVPHRYRVKK